MDLTLFQVAAIQTEVTKQQRETEEDLSKAEPALQAANAALNTLNRVITHIRTISTLHVTSKLAISCNSVSIPANE